MKKDIAIALIIGISIGSILALTVTNLPTIIKEGQKRTEKITLPTSTPISSIPQIQDLEIEKPLDGSISETDSIQVLGKSKPGNLLFIDTDSDTKIIEAGSDGNFSEKISLSEGANRIHVTKYDDSGEEQTKTLTVFYTPEKL